jgi:hypothetical protein
MEKIYFHSVGWQYKNAHDEIIADFGIDTSTLFWCELNFSCFSNDNYDLFLEITGKSASFI